MTTAENDRESALVGISVVDLLHQRLDETEGLIVRTPVYEQAQSADGEWLTEERIELMLSWKFSGFSVHNSVTAGPEGPEGIERRRLRRQWARMLRRIFEVDALLCDRGNRMRILSFITSPSALTKILTHLDSKARARGRDPTGPGSSSEEPAS